MLSAKAPSSELKNARNLSVIIKYQKVFFRDIIGVSLLSASQIRAARALLGWSGQDLADKCEISIKTLRRYEPQIGIPVGNTKVLITIQKVFEDQGIEFTGDPLVNPGVVLHLSKK